MLLARTHATVLQAFDGCETEERDGIASSEASQRAWIGTLQQHQGELAPLVAIASATGHDHAEHCRGLRRRVARLEAHHRDDIAAQWSDGLRQMQHVFGLLVVQRGSDFFSLLRPEAATRHIDQLARRLRAMEACGRAAIAEEWAVGAAEVVAPEPFLAVLAAQYPAMAITQQESAARDGIVATAAADAVAISTTFQALTALLERSLPLEAYEVSARETILLDRTAEATLMASASHCLAGVSMGRCSVLSLGVHESRRRAEVVCDWQDTFAARVAAFTAASPAVNSGPYVMAQSALRVDEAMGRDAVAGRESLEWNILSAQDAPAMGPSFGEGVVELAAARCNSDTVRMHRGVLSQRIAFAEARLRLSIVADEVLGVEMLLGDLVRGAVALRTAERQRLLEAEHNLKAYLANKRLAAALFLQSAGRGFLGRRRSYFVRLFNPRRPLVAETMRRTTRALDAILSVFASRRKTLAVHHSLARASAELQPNARKIPPPLRTAALPPPRHELAPPLPRNTECSPRLRKRPKPFELPQLMKKILAERSERLQAVSHTV